MLFNLLATPTRLAFGGAVVVVSVASVAGLTSSALFTDATSGGSDAFTTGEVVIDPNASGGTSFDASVGNMKIGDSKQRQILVKNDGSLAFNYTIGSSVSPASDAGLAAAIVGKLQLGACSGNSSTPLSQGPLSTLTMSTPRNLSAASSDTLCLTISLPTQGSNDADNLLQNKTVEAALRFTATQG